jgi:ADP-ribose pyrophosphatase YjhB (NUDIX family)/inorganic pyrophosphatase
VLIEDEGRILLVQRANEPYRDWWMLPAGFVEYGEDAAETAAREAMEETGLLVQVTGCLDLIHGAGDPRGASHLAVFSARCLGGTLTAGDDAAAARWFTASEIPDRIAFDAHRQALARWLGPSSRPRATALLRYASSGPASPVLVYVIIENPKGTADRIVYDPVAQSFVPSGEIFAEPLPIHYGWIPETWSAGDGRELDVVVVGEGSTSVGGAVVARPIGTLLRQDQDHKVLAVRADVPSAYADVTESAERPELREMVDGLFRPRAVLLGWASAAETRRLIVESQAAWIERFRPGC